MNRSFIRSLFLAAALSGAASVGWAQSGPLKASDLAELRFQMQQFQGLINRDLQASISLPFGMLQDPKGIYLPNFGVVFHMEVNLAPMRLISMFDVRPYTEDELQQTRRTKLQRIQELKTHLSELLRLHGGELSAIPPDQRIAVAVHLYNMPFERTEGLPTQIVVEATGGLLLDPRTKTGSAEEFRRKLSFLDF